MGKRRKTKSKTKRISFKLGTSKRKKITHNPSLKGILKVLAVVCVFAALGAGFLFLKGYVKKVVPVSEKTGFLELVDVPSWVSEPLKERIYAVASADGEDLRLDEEAAQMVAENLASVAWLYDTKVQTTHNSVRVETKFRKPLALVKSGLQKFYVDAELVVLDFVPMPNLPIVRVKGVSLTTMPPVGQVFERDDLAAAVDVLKLLWRMDELVTPDKPLLEEIEVIDVSNFAGRENSRAAHIVLYTKDRTQIVWGAEVGMWHRHLEAKDEDKLAMLYGFYEESGSLLGNVKYINLRDPQDKIPLPIDKY